MGKGRAWLVGDDGLASRVEPKKESSPHQCRAANGAATGLLSVLLERMPCVRWALH